MSLELFQRLLAEKTGIAPELQELRIGYPPTEIEVCSKVLHNGFKDSTE